MYEQSEIWSAEARDVWRVLTAKPGAMVWTERELAAATGRPWTRVAEALNELFLDGYVVPMFDRPGWRRA